MHVTRQQVAAETLSRQLRFFRELVRASRNGHRRLHQGGDGEVAGSTAARFPGAVALVFQSEHVMRTHDIPSLDYRVDTVFQYLVGGQHHPLVPLGVQRHGPRVPPAGGVATCALFHVWPTDTSGPSSTCATYAMSVDLFLTNLDDLNSTPGNAPHASTAASSKASSDERTLWHHTEGERPLLLGGPTTVDLFGMRDATYECRAHHHDVVHVAKRLWEVFRSKPPQGDAAMDQSSEGQNVLMRWTPEDLVRRHDLPFFAISCPSQRNTSDDGLVVPCTLFDIIARASGQESAAQPTLSSEEALSLKRQSVYHPVSAVLLGALLHRKTVAPTDAQQEVSAVGRGIDAALFQYTLPPRIGDAWGVPRRWEAAVPKGSSVSDDTTGLSLFLERVVEHTGEVATPSAEHLAERPSCSPKGSRLFVRQRAIQMLKPLVDNVRCVKSPYDARMFLRSAFVTRSCFISAMRQKASSEQHVLRALITGGWNASTPSSLSAAAVGLQTSVFGYPPVVAAGRNALAVHYTAAMSDVGAADWVLVDAGAELVGNYTTDCTRCWPVGRDAVQCFGRAGCHSSQVYGAVLSAQQSILRALRTGMSKKELSVTSKELLGNQIIALFQSTDPKQCSTASLQTFVHDALECFAMHSVGHFTGFDIHERGPPSHELEGGSMHTIEPGLYIRAHDDPLLASLVSVVPAVQSQEMYRAHVPAVLGGIGMRVEDSVFILPQRGHRTATGHTRPEYLDALLDEYALWCPPDEPVRSRRQLEISFMEMQASSMGITHHESDRSVPTAEGWYPHDIVVLTAPIPKSMDGLGAAMHIE